MISGQTWPQWEADPCVEVGSFPQRSPSVCDSFAFRWTLEEVALTAPEVSLFHRGICSLSQSSFLSPLTLSPTSHSVVCFMEWAVLLSSTSPQWLGLKISYLDDHLYIHPSVHLSVHPSVRPSVHLLTHLPAHLPSAKTRGLALFCTLRVCHL